MGRKFSKPQAHTDPVLAQWFADNGDRTLRLHYDLDERSLVFDLGGYKGQWTSDIYSMYRCQVHVFEPVEEFALGIKQRFSRNPDITVHRFGLASRNEVVRMSVDGDSSSVLKPGRNMVGAELVRAADFLQANRFQMIDLMKINIEGAEYDLLDHLLESEWVERIRNIQVQFHQFIPQADGRMRRIQERLGRSHELTYQYVFVWENWRLRR